MSSIVHRGIIFFRFLLGKGGLETGQVTLLKSAHGDDAGQPINPLMLDGQVLGGSTHMMGHALTEESLYDEKARALNPTWRDHKQPTSMDAPLETVFRGYYHSPEYNRKAFTEDGFYRTGDVVRVYRNQYVSVEGRIKDTINRDAEKISAEEVENHILAHPKVEAPSSPCRTLFLGKRGVPSCSSRGISLSTFKISSSF
jgi:acyl-CoA synthetase (AMP-forming)/AMP-acid ligase II